MNTILIRATGRSDNLRGQSLIQGLFTGQFFFLRDHYVSIILDSFWPSTHYITVNTVMNVSKTYNFLDPHTQFFCWRYTWMDLSQPKWGRENKCPLAPYFHLSWANLDEDSIERENGRNADKVRQMGRLVTRRDANVNKFTGVNPVMEFQSGKKVFCLKQLTHLTNYFENNH